MATTKKILMSAAGNVAGGEAYWISTWGGTGTDYGYSVTTDISDNIYVAGYTASTGAGSVDFLIAKYDSTGSIVWQRTLGGTENDYGYSVTTDSSGNVYVTGYTASTSSYDILLAKYDSSGSLVWQRTLGGSGIDIGQSVTTDSSGNIYVTGRTSSATYFFVVKYDSAGSLVWKKILYGSSNEYGQSVTTDSSGNIYAVGRTNSTGAGLYDILLAKYNSAGSVVWQRTLGGTGDDFGQSVTTDSSGNIYVAGYTSSTGAGGVDALLAKYDSAGSIVWQRTLGGTGDDYGWSVTTDSSDNVYLACSTYSTGAGGGDILLAKYDTSGSLVWQRTLGGTGTDIGCSVATDSSGSVYVASPTTSTGAGGYDFLLVKLPPDGSLTGTYGAFTYAESSLTAATSSLTSATSSLSQSNASLTSVASSMTDLGIVQHFTLA